MKHFKVFVMALLPFLSACQGGDILIHSGDFELAVNKKAQITRLVEKSSGTDYSIKTGDSYLLRIRINSIFETPSALSYDSNDSTATLSFPVNDVEARIKITGKGSYLTFELISITHPDIIEIVCWGPFKTSIGKTVGETIGVVRNEDFAIGIQALNPRTLGGYPTNEDDSFKGYDIFATTSLVDVADSVNILYRGDAARPESFGSSLCAYTRSRDKERIVACMDHDRYLSPAFKDGGIVGSKIAIFGCKPAAVLDVIEKIEIIEGLPHPLLNGEWAKRARQATSAYLIQYFDKTNYRRAIELTKKAGLKYLYHGGPFRTWGHFVLENDMTWDDLAHIVSEAESEGIKVGVHTLSNFITTNDAYVTPVPDPGLARVGSSALSDDITADARNIPVEDPAFFNQMKNNSLHAVVTGDELIRYEKVSDSAPWFLLNCERGAYGTTSSSHKKGDPIAKLADHPYNTFLTDNELSAGVSQRIADLFNKTGLKQISFDGLEGNYSTGMGSYGELLFVKNWYDHLDPAIKDDYIMDASRSGHYFWHMFTRMNWGEPWYAGFRESQTTYRLLNQDYFRRNYIPCMLGWFSMSTSTSIEDIEWMLARSAAFDAGYALVMDATVVDKNGYGEQILDKIKIWEKARMSGAFSAEQKKRMENIRAEFTLLPGDEGQWFLQQFEVQRYEHKYRELQPGQPTWSEIEFTNPYREQPLRFIITVSGGSASYLSFETDNFRKVELDIEIKPGEYLKYDGGNTIVLYSSGWQKIRELPAEKEKLMLSPGKHTIKADCVFSGKRESALKLELKTAGDPENVSPH